MPLTDTAFDELSRIADSEGVDAACEWLAKSLKEEGRFHELYEVRLIQARRRNKAPLISAQSLDELAEPLRSRMEEACVAACREVGDLLLDAKRLREAWLYLRVTGEKQRTANLLKELAGENQDEIDAYIDLAVREGVCPAFGFELVIEHFGLCNAITMFDGEMHSRTAAERAEVAELLIRHVYAELVANLKADIARKEGTPPAGETVEELIAGRDWVFDENNYHVDTSHLAAIVRFATAVTEPELLRLASGLAEYGRRLAKLYQFAGHPPFERIYDDHLLFFRAQLGEDVEAAIQHFREHAERAAAEGEYWPVDVYIAFLARLKRYREAIDAAAQLAPKTAGVLRMAPSVAELAKLSGEYDRMLEACRGRDDIVGFATALFAKAMAERAPSAK